MRALAVTAMFSVLYVCISPTLTNQRAAAQSQAEVHPVVEARREYAAFRSSRRPQPHTPLKSTLLPPPPTAAELERASVQRVIRTLLEEAGRLPDGSRVAAQWERAAAAAIRLLPTSLPTP